MIPEILAWREFSKGVEARLQEQHDDGYTGWDGSYPTKELLKEMTDDALLLEREEGDKESCIDVAARAMMIYRRLDF